jgi:hypothetical protein
MTQKIRKFCKMKMYNFCVHYSDYHMLNIVYFKAKFLCHTKCGKHENGNFCSNMCRITRRTRGFAAFLGNIFSKKLSLITWYEMQQHVITLLYWRLGCSPKRLLRQNITIKNSPKFPYRSLHRNYGEWNFKCHFGTPSYFVMKPSYTSTLFQLGV